MISLFTIWTRARDAWSYRHEPEVLRSLADAYWRALLFVVMLLIIAIALYSGLRLFEILTSSEEKTALQRSGGGAALNRAELETMLNSFVEKEVRYEYLKKNRPQIADPSR